MPTEEEEQSGRRLIPAKRQEKEAAAGDEQHDNLACSNSVSGASRPNGVRPEGIHHTEPAMNYFAREFD